MEGGEGRKEKDDKRKKWTRDVWTVQNFFKHIDLTQEAITGCLIQ